MPPRKKNTEPTPLEAVSQLMSERQKYEKWLRDLDAKKDSTPQHVFDRVRGDYTTRLDEVVNNLKQHATAMQEHARTLMVRLKELEVSEEELQDEMSENELRAQIGELTAGEWEIQKKKAERLLAKFKEDQQLVADDLNRIREILSGATRGDDRDTPTQLPRHSTDFDELEFLKSVVGTTTPAVSSTPPSTKKSEAEARAEPAKAAEPGPPAPKAEPVAEKAAAQPAAAPAAPAPAKPKPQVHETPATALRKSIGTEVPKTLKCSECGTMNFPSEWYCERCGAELTVV